MKNDNEKLPKYSRLDRKQFLKIIGAGVVTTLPDLVFGNIYGEMSTFLSTIGSSSADELKAHVAFARALSHVPGDKHVPLSKEDYNEYILRRAASLSLLGVQISYKSPSPVSEKAFSKLTDAADPSLLYKSLASEIVASKEAYRPLMAVADAYNDLGTKGKLSLTGTGLAAGTRLIGLLYPATAIAMGYAGVAAGGVSIASILLKDDNTIRLINDAALLSAQEFWNAPSSTRVLKPGIKNKLSSSYGINFDASVETNKAYLPENVKSYVDLYLDNMGLSPDQRQRNEEDLTNKIVTEINKSFDSSVEKIINHMKDTARSEAQARKEAMYEENELRGGLYLASFLADKLIGEDAGKVVNTLGNSALQMSSMLSALSMGTMGPLGMAAGCVTIAMNLAGLFGKKGPTTDQIIKDSIDKLQKSIQELHKQMVDLFGIVIENQHQMMKRIDQQFEIVKEKQNQALDVLEQIKTDLQISINGDRERGRNVATDALGERVLSLDSEINKKRLGKKVNDQEIEAVIRKAYAFGLTNAQFTDFTGLPKGDNATLKWNAANMIAEFKRMEQIDFFVGRLPMMLQYFTKEKSNYRVYNPNALGRAALVCGVTYSTFPAVAKLFEGGNSHYLKDFNDAINSTRSLLFKTVHKDTIQKFTETYLDILDRTIEEALKVGEETAWLSNSVLAGRKLMAAGPCNEIKMEVASSVDATWFDQINGNQILERENFLRNGEVVSVVDIRELHVNFGTFKAIKWKGLNPQDINIVSEMPEFFAAMKKYYILDLESKPVITRPISYSTVVSVPIDAPYGGTFITAVTAEEEVKPHMIVFLQEAIFNKGEIVDYIGIGHAVDGGWIESKVKNIKSVLNVPNFTNTSTYPDQSMSYISKDLLGYSQVGGSSSSFLDKIKEQVNLNYRLKTEVITNAIKVIKDSKNQSTLEFEATAACIKYIAGINAYTQTGDLELGTSIATDKVAGIRSYISEDLEGNITKETDDLTYLPSSRSQICDLISKITTTNYLYHPDHVRARGESGLELKEYIRAEIKLIANKAVQDYTQSYFPPTTKNY